MHGKAHFTSWHAKVGLTVFILSIVAPLGGIVSFRKFGLLQRLPEKLQPQVKGAHRAVSQLSLLKHHFTPESAQTRRTCQGQSLFQKVE